MEWYVGFLIIFMPLDLVEGQNIRVHEHAVRICREAYEESKVKSLDPVQIFLPPGVMQTTPHVFACLRRGPKRQDV